MDVTFTITDHTWMIEDVMVKGSMSGWGVFQAYDDGTNGDVTAGDHVWTAQYTTPMVTINGVQLILIMVMELYVQHVMALMAGEHG